MKRHMIAAIVIPLALVAGCQQRTEFDACVEYYEQKIRDQEGAILDLTPEEVWIECKQRGG